MTPLDAARRLAETEHTYEAYYFGNFPTTCLYCEGRTVQVEGGPLRWYSEFKHEDACPTLALPRIVSALEAAEAVVGDYKPQRTWAEVMLRLDAALRDEAA